MRPPDAWLGLFRYPGPIEGGFDHNKDKGGMTMQHRPFRHKASRRDVLRGMGHGVTGALLTAATPACARSGPSAGSNDDATLEQILASRAPRIVARGARAAPARIAVCRASPAVYENPNRGLTRTRLGA